MPTGSCFCGNVKYEYQGEPEIKALCHCYDCKKIGGGNYSNNFIVNEDGFKVTQGTPKTISKKADGGNEITSHFCPDCGSTMFRSGKSFEGKRIIKAGTLDDHSLLDEHAPGAELYAPQRVKWIPEYQGAGQVPGMPS